MRLATQRLTDMIIRHEGERLNPYHDSEGILTIGAGRNLTRKPAISYQESRFMLKHDIEGAEEDLAVAFPWLVCRDDVVRLDVLVDMVFNLGIHRFKGFKRMIAALKCDDYDAAAREMLDSKWARQVGRRATELAHMMATGHYEWEAIP